MTTLQAILLGIIQGLTEFLPISSSAHLVLVPYFFGWQIPPTEAFIFDVLVQVASLIAVVTYFWKDLVTIVRSVLECLARREPFKEPAARLGWLIVLATIPAGLIGLGLKSAIEDAFSSPTAVAFFLLITAGLLIAAERIGKRTRPMEEVNWKDALMMGVFQAIAIFPGVSRSGATITGGMGRNLERPAAARFAFLMVVPIMLAAGLLATKDLLGMQGVGSLLPVFLPGLIASAIVSYLSIRWLMRYLMRHSLYVFAAYCLALAVVVFLVSALR